MSRFALTCLEAGVRRGGLAREAAFRLAAVDGLGPRGAWRRLRFDRELAHLGDEPWDRVYRRIWGDAAETLGATVEELGAGILELRRGNAVKRVWRQVTDLDGPVAMRYAFDRGLTFRALAQAGVPIPEHIEVDLARPQDAMPFLADGGAVLKPFAGTGVGSGVTSGILRGDQLRRAIVRSSRYERLLLERQVPGAVYRLLYLDGELLGAVRKLPPTVEGDGRSTVEELVAAENRRRLDARGGAQFSLLKLDLDALFTLEAAGLRPGSVPAAGSRVVVKAVTNQNRIEDNETVLAGELADALVAEGAAASAAVGLRLAGVDVVTRDISAALRETAGCVIEVNCMPGLNHHYNVGDRATIVPVAVPVLTELLGLPR